MTIGDYSRIRQKREGSLSVLAPRRQTQCDSHREKAVRRESPWGPPDPPFFGKEGDHQVPQTKQPKKKA